MLSFLFQPWNEKQTSQIWSPLTTKAIGVSGLIKTQTKEMHLSITTGPWAHHSCYQVAWGKPTNIAKLSDFCFYFLLSALLIQQVLICSLHYWPSGTALLSWGCQGKNRSLPVSADTRARKQWPRPGKTFLLTYIGHYSLTIFVTNIFNNNHGQAFESQVLSICKGKILASPCLWTTFGIYSINIYLLVAYCGPDTVLTGRVT